jgi:hypothetical protein
MSRFVRSALLGLAGGLFLAALALAGSALSRLRVDCAPLSAEECNLERQLASELARVQSLGALGCALVAAGLVLGARRPS